MSRTITARTSGEAWRRAHRAVLRDGERGRDGDEEIRELLHLTLIVQRPDPDDSVISRRARPGIVEWMRSNFREVKLVPELGNSPSYAMRLRNRIPWVIRRLRKKPETKSATITTLLDGDESYIPCVSLLDFKIRDGALILTCACRSIDVGVKMPANLVALAELQRDVAEAVGCRSGEMVLWVSSAHVYERDVVRGKRRRGRERSPARA